MKKLLLALVAFFVSIAANAADYYKIQGPWDDGSTWYYKDMTEDNGKWYITIDFKLTQGSGINFGIQKNGSEWISSADDNTTVYLDQDLNAKTNGTSWWMTNFGKHTVVYYPSENKIRVYAGDYKGESSAIVAYDLYGSGWGNNGWGNKTLTNNDGKWEIKDLELDNGNEFGIRGLDASGTQKQWYWGESSSNTFTGASTLKVVAQNANQNNGTNFKYTGSKAKYNLSFDPKAMTLTVTAASVAEDVITYGVIYGQDGQSGWVEKDMAKANGKYAVDLNIPKDYLFHLYKVTNGTKTYIGANNTSVCYINGLPANSLSAKDGEMNWQINFTATEATYTFDPSNYTLSVVKKQGGGDVPSGETITVYLHVTGWANPTAYTWTTVNGKTTKYSGDYPGNSMTKVRDGYYSITVDKNAKNVVFSNNRNSKTNDYVLVDKHIYEIGKSAGYQGEAYDPNQTIIYFNGGADYFSAKEMNKQTPVMHVWDGSWHQVGTMRNVDGEEAMFMLEVPDQYRSTAWAVKFTANGLEYDGGMAEGFDKGNWTKYIYGPGSKVAYQSYLTFEEYKQLRDNAKDAIYLIGDGVGNGSWNRNNLTKVVKDEGVYIFNMTAGGTITFKMSYINVPEYTDRKPAGYDADNASDNDKRWWATFNLGIIGSNIKNADGSMKESGRPQNGNAYVTFEPGRTNEFNFWNQFDWKAENTDANYHVVVDADFHSTALLKFNPQPSISEVTVNKLVVEPASQYGLEYLTGQEIYGAEVSGDAVLSYVNHASGSATITAAANNDLRNNNYGVEYQFAYNGEPMGVFTEQPTKVSLDYMVARHNAVVTMRALYTDQQAGQVYKDDVWVDGENLKGQQLRFRSHTATGNINNDYKLDAPQFSVGDYKQLFAQGNLGSDENTIWNALLHVDYEMPHAHPHAATGVERAAYPAFKIESMANGAKGEIAEANNWMVVVDPNFRKGDYQFHTPVFNATASNYTHSANNWAELSNKAISEDHKRGTLHVNVPQAVIAGFDNVNLQVKINGYAAYPFVVKPEGGITIDTATGARRRMVRAGVSEREANEFGIITEHVPAVGNDDLIATLSKADLSGITDATVAAGDGEAEYYNLQGVRVQGEIVPGVYIVRRGDKVSKEIVK